MNTPLETTMVALYAREQAEIRAEAAVAAWDAEYPDWRERSVEPEERESIPANYVSDPHAPFVARRYGGDYGRLIPGCDGEEY